MTINGALSAPTLYTKGAVVRLKYVVHLRRKAIP